MIRLAVAICAPMVFLADVSAVFAADAKPAPQAAKVYSSPQEVFDAWRAAIKKKDWRTVFFSGTASARNGDVYAAYVECCTKGDPKEVAVLKKFGIDDASGRILSEYYRRYKDKHGVDIGKLTADREAKRDKLVAEYFKKHPPADGQRENPDIAVPGPTIDEPQLGPPLPADDPELLRNVVVDAISDKAGFFAAAHDVLDSDQPSNPRVGPLEQIKIKGDSAEGVATLTSFIESESVSESGVQCKTVHRYDSKERFHFTKTADGWLRG
jgi:hypothetical protein